MRLVFALLLVAACSSRDAEPPAQTKPRSAEIVAPKPVKPALPQKPPVPGLAEDLRDADPKVRAAAVREAATDANPDPAIFLAASRDTDRNVAVMATETLGKLHANGQVPVEEMIARATDRSLDERVRTSAINGLGLVPSAEAAKTLVELAQRGDTLERRSAAILLVHQDAAIAVPVLIEALADSDEVVRGNALEALRSRARGRDFGTDAAAWRTWWQSRSR
jgi:HEAT repeat protein